MSRIRITKARRKIKAQRDEQGVPHIEGTTMLDVLYGLGYMHAADRGTQLLFSRVVASGRATERISDQPELLDTDRFFRRVGLHQNLDEEVEKMDDRSFDQLTAYCEGVNDGIKASGRSLPMWATGFHPQPWNHQAVLLVGKLISFGGLAISQMQNERLLVELVHAGANIPALCELLAPDADPSELEILRHVQMSNKLSDDALELITDLPRLAGSNAWAVAPSRSATGSALLASDPHLEVNRLPAIWYEVALRWGDHYVMGASLPGCPLFAVARTDKVAWGVTYMKGDTIDFFIEDCRPGGETGWQYRRGRKWRDFEVREEVIQRKETDDETLRVYHNPQGILDTNPSDLGSGYHLSLAWTGHAEGGIRGITTWIDMISAPSTSAAMDIARECPQPTLCWIIADHEGHIGLQGCGLFPERSGHHNGLLPVPAWDKKNHWKGWLPVDQLPRIYDPPCGFVATANENINQPHGPRLVTQPVPAYRKIRLQTRLEQMPRATLQDMQQLQYDLVSVQARDMLNVFLPHLPEGKIKDRLSNWDYSYSPDSREATLFQRLYRNVMVEVFGHEEGIGWRRMLYLCTRAGFSTMVLTAADNLLKRQDSIWWHKRDKGELIRKAAEQLENEPDQPWSDVNYFHFTDRFFGTHQVGRMLGYNSRRHAMPGNYATLFQGHVMLTARRESTFAPSYHFVTDMGTDEAWSNLPGGPSEKRFSRHYKSGIERWFSGEYKLLAPTVKDEDA